MDGEGGHSALPEMRHACSAGAAQTALPHEVGTHLAPKVSMTRGGGQTGIPADFAPTLALVCSWLGKLARQQFQRMLHPPWA